MIVNIKVARKKSGYSLTCQPTDTIAVLKRLIEENNSKFPAAGILITHKGKEQRDDVVISDLKLTKDDQLVIMKITPKKTEPKSVSPQTTVNAGDQPPIQGVARKVLDFVVQPVRTGTIAKTNRRSKKSSNDANVDAEDQTTSRKITPQKRKHESLSDVAAVDQAHERSSRDVGPKDVDVVGAPKRTSIVAATKSLSKKSASRSSIMANKETVVSKHASQKRKQESVSRNKPIDANASPSHHDLLPMVVGEVDARTPTDVNLATLPTKVSAPNVNSTVQQSLKLERFGFHPKEVQHFLDIANNNEYVALFLLCNHTPLSLLGSSSVTPSSQGSASDTTAVVSYEFATGIIGDVIATKVRRVVDVTDQLKVAIEVGPTKSPLVGVSKISGSSIVNMAATELSTATALVSLSVGGSRANDSNKHSHADVMLMLWTELHEIVKDAEYARVFFSIGGLPVLIRCIAKHKVMVRPIVDVCLAVVATLCANNPTVQDELVEKGLLEVLCNVFFKQCNAADDGAVSTLVLILHALRATILHRPSYEDTYCSLPSCHHLIIQGLNVRQPSNVRQTTLLLLHELVASSTAGLDRFVILQACLEYVSKKFVMEERDGRLRALALDVLNHVLEIGGTVAFITSNRSKFVVFGEKELVKLGNRASKTTDVTRDRDRLLTFVKLVRAEVTPKTVRVVDDVANDQLVNAAVFPPMQ